jgi:hypothetical protein
MRAAGAPRVVFCSDLSTSRLGGARQRACRPLISAFISCWMVAGCASLHRTRQPALTTAACLWAPCEGGHRFRRARGRDCLRRRIRAGRARFDVDPSLPWLTGRPGPLAWPSRPLARAPCRRQRAPWPAPRRASALPVPRRACMHAPTRARPLGPRPTWPLYFLQPRMLSCVAYRCHTRRSVARAPRSGLLRGLAEHVCVRQSRGALWCI